MSLTIIILAALVVPIAWWLLTEWDEACRWITVIWRDEDARKDAYERGEGLR